MTPVSLLSFKVLAKVFSRGALESYLPRLQDTIKSEIAKWCSEPGSIDVYSAAKSLTFRIAVAVLLGLQLEEERIVYLAKIFEQLMNNLFSLPIDAPCSGLRKVSDPTVTFGVKYQLGSTVHGEPSLLRESRPERSCTPTWRRSSRRKCSGSRRRRNTKTSSTS